MRLVLGIALAIAALVVAFVWLRAGSPSDGVRLVPADYNFLADGISISLSEARPGELREGDRLVALDGVSVEQWARALFEPAAARPAWSFGQTATYTVVRDGQRLDVPVTLRPYSFGPWLAGYWGTLALALGYELVAGFVFLRRAHDPAARVMFLASSCLAGATIPWSMGLQLSDLTGALGFWLYAAIRWHSWPACISRCCSRARCWRSRGAPGSRRLSISSVSPQSSPPLAWRVRARTAPCAGSACGTRGRT
ncbi:MAG: hypothetical protein E6J26_11410 [Chloroflexi bacterium]|nr:MAG: hypothetical protein E6J26_11410 [Chloroflexota bacterium]